MSTSIYSAELVKYNANPRGKSVGDCVKRSMSAAFGMSYSDIGKLLNTKMHDMHKDYWNIQPVYNSVIKDLGGSDPKRMNDKDVTVEMFADDIAEPSKVYLVLCGAKYGTTTHMVCVRDKTIWDSWDCREYIVTRYHDISSTSANTNQVTDIKEHIPDLIENYADPILKQTFDLQMDKRGWEGNLYHKTRYNQYTAKARFRLALGACDYSSKMREYYFDIAFVFNPTMSDDDAIEYIKKIAKQRMYDRIWSINEQEKRLIEADEIRRSAGIQDDDDDYDDKYWMTPQEERFLKTLPGWVKPLVEYIDIERPGVYSNSYTLRISKLPEDDIHNNIRTFSFRGKTSSDIKEQLVRYKATLELPRIDYDTD